MGYLVGLVRILVSVFFFFFFLPDLWFGFDFCQFWVVGNGCRCAGGLLVMGVGDLANCGVVCQGGGGFFVHSSGVEFFFFFFFKLNQTMVLKTGPEREPDTSGSTGVKPVTS